MLKARYWLQRSNGGLNESFSLTGRKPWFFIESDISRVWQWRKDIALNHYRICYSFSSHTNAENSALVSCQYMKVAFICIFIRAPALITLHPMWSLNMSDFRCGKNECRKRKFDHSIINTLCASNTLSHPGKNAAKSNGKSIYNKPSERRPCVVYCIKRILFPESW